MAATVEKILLTPEVRSKVITDSQELIEQEISDKSGISGTTVKLAYKTARTFVPGYLQSVLEPLLPDMAGKLEPYLADFTASGASVFRDYLVKRGDEVSEALLSVTDSRTAFSRLRRRCRRRRSVSSRCCWSTVSGSPCPAAPG